MLARFLTNNRGGVVPLMARSLPSRSWPRVGIAVDYSRINAARTAFQVALDATVLMDVKKCGDGNDAQRQTEATNTFNSLFSRPEVTDITISPNFTSAGGSKLTLNGTAVVHTNFLGIIGVSVSDGHYPADRRSKTPRTAGTRANHRSTRVNRSPATTSRPPALR